MKQIGVLAADEGPFPQAVIEKINSLEKDVKAGLIKEGHVTSGHKFGYDVIIDRISHWNLFFRTYLEAAAVSGVKVINNPFWASVDNKFLECVLAPRAGFSIPKTLLIPPRSYPVGARPKDLKNVKFPLDWDAMIETVGSPAILKPYDGRGWRHVSTVNGKDELIEAYNKTNERVMILQEKIEWSNYVRCIVVGKKDVLVIPYHPETRTYQTGQSSLDDETVEKIEKNALAICTAFNYDLNSVEFAVKDNEPYAIDFMNPVPDFNPKRIPGEYFDWGVEKLAEFAAEAALKEKQEPLFPEIAQPPSVFPA